MTTADTGPDGLLRHLEQARSVLAGDGPLVVLSGAGMSAESGVPTFRDAQTGMWARVDPAELASPDAWGRDADTVWAWYRWREHLVSRAEPNAGHRAVARAATARHVVVVTQNVDDLHERAGSTIVHHVHGSLFAHRCEACGVAADAGRPPEDPVDRLAPPECPLCGGRVRPGVVWFGENLPADPWEASLRAIDAAAAVLVVGTSGLVHPAASLPDIAAEEGIPVVEVNPGPSGLGPAVTVHVRAPAGEAVPALLRR